MSPDFLLIYFVSNLVLCVIGHVSIPTGDYALNITKDVCVQVSCFEDAEGYLAVYLFAKCGEKNVTSSYIEMDEASVGIFSPNVYGQLGYGEFKDSLRTDCAPVMSITDGDMKNLIFGSRNEKLYLSFGGRMRDLTKKNGVCKVMV